MNLQTKALVLVSALAFFTLPAAADVVQQTTTTTTTTLWNDAPIYTGPVVEAELQELTLGDFQQIGGSKPNIVADYYNDYVKELEKPLPNPTPVLYKVKITRVLTEADFQGNGVSPELAQTRYRNYIATQPIKDEGRFVYVLHTPVGRRIAE